MTYTFSVAARSQLDALLQVNDYPAAYILLSDILKAADPVTGSGGLRYQQREGRPTARLALQR